MQLHGLASARSPWRSALAGCGLIAVTFVSFAPSLRGGYVWDDPISITDNETLRSAAGLRKIWLDPTANYQYYPLLFSSFWVEYRLWGLDPLGYHAVNIALHAANAILVWQLLRYLGLPGALFAAAIFAAHPLQAESVAWISERKNLLSGFLYLSALLAWLGFLDGGKWRRYAAACGLFVLALLAKATACTFPVIAFVVGLWRAPRQWRRVTLCAVPLLAAAALFGTLTMWREGFGDDPESLALRPVLSLAERAVIAGRAVWFYAGKLIWPFDLMRIYPKWEVSAGLSEQLLFPAVVIAVLGALWLARKRLGAAPLVAVTSFIVALAPTLGIIWFDFMEESYVADHLQYLASIALIALAVGPLAAGAARLGRGLRRARGPAALSLVLGLALLSRQQAALYASPETLWRDTLAGNPNAPTAHNNLGVDLARRGSEAEALAHYRAAVRLRPDFIDAHYNLGNALKRTGDLTGAVREYQTVLRLSVEHADAHNSLGAVLFRLGETGEAIRHYREAVRLDPEHWQAHYNLGRLLVRRGALEEAAAHFAATVRINPGFLYGHTELGRIRLAQGKFDDAVRQYTAALRIDPDSAESHYNLGLALSRQGKAGRAAEHFAAAAKLDPAFRAPRRALE